MLICSELIEENGRPPGLILACGIFLAWFEQIRVVDFFTHLKKL